jgi:hypothetical protein
MNHKNFILTMTIFSGNMPFRLIEACGFPRFAWSSRVFEDVGYRFSYVHWKGRRGDEHKRIRAALKKVKVQYGL